MACLALLVSTAAMAENKHYAYQSVQGDPMQTRIYTLDNGLKVYLSVNNEKPRIQTYIAVRTGSRNDPAETTGLAHYLEHLMFKGTQQFGTTDYAKEKPLLDDIEQRYEVYRHLTDPDQRRQAYHEIDSVSQLAAQYNIPNEYDKLMSSIGATGTNAYTSDDVTCYTENIPSNEVENWAQIQSDRFQNMVIRGFHTELEAVYEEYNIGLASDNRKLWAAIGKLLFPNHPYGTQTTIGTQEHLKNPSITNIKNYFQRYYVPNNVAICMAGDFDPDQVIATLDKYFGTWKPSPTLSFPTYEPVKDLTHPVDTTIVGQEAEFMAMAWKFDKASSLQCDTVQVISQMLFNGKAGLFDLDLNQQMRCLYSNSMVNTMNEYTEFILAGMPNEGQSLKEVQGLLLDEIEKFKRGDFDDDLLPSVVNNLKLAYINNMESNEERADMFVNAFINGTPWEQEVGAIKRVEGMTKQQLIDFARRHLIDNYVAIYKVQGTDSTQKKIDKPAITAIPSNRELQSQFVADIIAAKTQPIEPRFLNYADDITRGKTKQGLPILYVGNTENDRFSLTFRYNFGEESNKWLPYAHAYLDLLGTDTKTAEQIKRQFYKLACDYSIGVSSSELNVSLTGLGENMAEAILLLEDFLKNAKVDQQAYKAFVDQQIKERKDAKLNQRSNFGALTSYGTYGPYNPQRNVPSEEELRQQNPQQLIDMLGSLSNYEHQILYYGPASLKQLTAILNKNHKTAKHLQAAPQGKPYVLQTTSKNEILLAPYEAKNIYMMQYNCEGRQWDPEQQPLVQLFNEYFGGGMNGVVFQELRESRGLAYSAWADYTTPWRKSDPEYARTNIISQNDKMMDCIRVFGQILDTIPQSDKAFLLAKQALTKKMEAARTTKISIITSYLAAQRRGIDYDINEKVYRALPSITLQDLVKFETETMAHKPWRYMILGDEKNLDIPALEKIAPIKRVTTEDIFGY